MIVLNVFLSSSKFHLLKQWFPTFLAPGTGLWCYTKKMVGKPQWFKHLTLIVHFLSIQIFIKSPQYRCSHMQFTVGFELLWESNATVDLAGGGAQVVMWIMGTICKYRWRSAHLPLSSCSVAYFGTLALKDGAKFSFLLVWPGLLVSFLMYGLWEGRSPLLTVSRLGQHCIENPSRWRREASFPQQLCGCHIGSRSFCLR